MRAAYGLMESINGLNKAERIRTTVFDAGPFRLLADVEFATSGWVDWYTAVGGRRSGGR